MSRHFTWLWLPAFILPSKYDKKRINSSIYQESIITLSSDHKAVPNFTGNVAGTILLQWSKHGWIVLVETIPHRRRRGNLFYSWTLMWLSQSLLCSAAIWCSERFTNFKICELHPTSFWWVFPSLTVYWRFPEF